MIDESDEIKELIEADPAYSAEEFTFTFTRAEISAIVASVQACREQLTEPSERALCRSVLARIGSNETYVRSKRPLKRS